MVFWIIAIYRFHALFSPNPPFALTELVNNIFFILLMGLILITLNAKTKITAAHSVLVMVFSLVTVVSYWSSIDIMI